MELAVSSEGEAQWKIITHSRWKPWGIVRFFVLNVLEEVFVYANAQKKDGVVYSLSSRGRKRAKGTNCLENVKL